jgi:hypothetical protein
MYPYNAVAARAVEIAFQYAAQGKSKDAKTILKQAKQQTGFSFVDCSSANGIPDWVCIGEVDANKYERERNRTEAIRLVHLDCELSAIKEGVFEELWETSPFASEDELTREMRKTKQFLTGSCNQREENKILYAAELCKLGFSAFVSKATLYMARFINRHRRNELGHPYHPGEAYLFMEHGEQMQDAFTPEEVTQAMEKVGISGSRVASELMAELERQRNARMNPEI